MQEHTTTDTNHAKKNRENFGLEKKVCTVTNTEKHIESPKKQKKNPHKPAKTHRLNFVADNIWRCKPRDTSTRKSKKSATTTLSQAHPRGMIASTHMQFCAARSSLSRLRPLVEQPPRPVRWQLPKSKSTLSSIPRVSEPPITRKRRRTAKDAANNEQFGTASKKVNAITKRLQ